MARSIFSSIGVAVSCPPGCMRPAGCGDDQLSAALGARTFAKYPAGEALPNRRNGGARRQIDAALREAARGARVRALSAHEAAKSTVRGWHTENRWIGAAIRAERNQLAGLPALDVRDREPVARSMSTVTMSAPPSIR